MSEPMPYIHRDISWLSFNYRVLQEAKDVNVPLYERLKFLAIYSSNLNEFFRVRVANHSNLLRAGKKHRKGLDFEPVQVLKQILKIVNLQQEEFSDIFQNNIVPALAKQNINILKRKQLNPEQIKFVEDYYEDKLAPHVQPMLLKGTKIKPFLGNSVLYLGIVLLDKEDEIGDAEFALVKIPSDLFPRFVVLPSNKKGDNDLIILDDVIRHNMRKAFPGYIVDQNYSLKLTRDAELYIDDEYSGNLITKIKKGLSKRNVGIASRMVVDRRMPNDFIEYLQKVLDVEKRDVLTEGRYHNNFDFFRFPSFGQEHLKDPEMPPLVYKPLEKSKNFFKSMKESDHLIHVPYHSYDSVVRFFEEAAEDPKVTHIKAIQYRVAKKSRIMNALMKAVKNGKQVFVFIEVKARFDEEANLAWGEKLEAAGVNVLYSIPGIKVHSKMAIIRRQEEKNAQLYLYYSTGNFHEETAKLYSDIGVFTVDKRLTKEALRVFSYLETKKLPEKKFQHLAVGTFNLKALLLSHIDKEIENAKKGKKAAITIKLNSLQDEEMINKLYKASQHGVKIEMIVRGICSLVPGIKGISENIKIRSIVDRFLEHARIYIYHNNGDPKIYLASADWMVRNLHHRIETVFPIYDENARQTILDIMNLQLRDNVKSRIIHYKNNNKYFKDAKELAVRSQVESYFYFKRKQDTH